MIGPEAVVPVGQGGALGGHKSLYSTSYYTEAAFSRLYNGPAHEKLKREYDSAGRLPGLYDKCVRGR